jgi:DNA mismatch endonuclease (patch repair protein)
MADTFSRKKRSWIMSRIKGRGTQPEKIVRTILRRRGFHIRGYDKSLPGSPDIVLKDRKKVIFINGCFWHAHRLCQRSRRPTTNREFWNKKIDGNIRRDLRVRRQLRRLGWNVLVLWECRIKKKPVKTEEKIGEFLKGKASTNVRKQKNVR